MLSVEAQAVSEFKQDPRLLGVLAFAHLAPFLANDSMGPYRFAKTDAIPEETIRQLGHFGTAIVDHDKVFVVATAGPKIEGTDILKALGQQANPKAFAVVENGGMLLIPNGKGNFEKIPIAHPEEVKKLGVLEAHVAQDPLLEIMQNDKEVENGKKPIRTPYETSMVLTLPPSYEEFCQRLEEKGFHDLVKIIPGIDASNYVNLALAYARDLYAKGIQELNLEDSLTIVVKGPNRRIYITTKHNKNGKELNKRTGTELGATLLHSRGIPLFSVEHSIYTADAAKDTTREGAVVLGASEKPMIVGDPVAVDERDLIRRNLIKVVKINYHGQGIYVAQPVARLVFNVTLKDGSITMETVEGVHVINVKDGIQALKVQEEILKQFHA